MGRLIIDGKRVFEVDEECMRRKGMQHNRQNHLPEEFSNEKEETHRKEYNEEPYRQCNHDDIRKRQVTLPFSIDGLEASAAAIAATAAKKQQDDPNAVTSAASVAASEVPALVSATEAKQ